ncbi:hypothetical protein Tco_0230967 [Tanacetum coccineum]
MKQFRKELNKNRLNRLGLKQLKDVLKNGNSSKNKHVVSTSNAFSVLSEDTFIGDDDITTSSVKESTWQRQETGDSDGDDVENVYDETGTFMGSESHVDISRLEKVCAKVCTNWKWTSNGSLCDKGSRIVLGWNSDVVDVMIIAQTDQVIHTLIVMKSIQKALFSSFVYAGNAYTHRHLLWKDLCMHKRFVNDKPWVLMGDFNAALYLEDTFCGSSNINIAMREFRECVEAIEVGDVNSTGLHFTWNQKPKAEMGMLKKIDRVMCNIYFTNEFPGSYVIFQPYRNSDHAPAVLKIQQVTNTNPKPFKFSNFVAYKPKFKQLVEEGWKHEVNGYNMFKVVKKLRLLKKSMRKLVMNHGNLHARVVSLRHELDEVQKALDKDPSSNILREEEALYLKAFNEAMLDEERYLKQKAMIEWLSVGDSNSSYFHKMVKSKVSRSRVGAVLDSNNTIHEGTSVAKAFVNHYSNFLGMEGNISPLDTTNLFHIRLDSTKAAFMCREVSINEIKDAMFSIGNDKAPGPDEYSSFFFKKAWDIVGEDVCRAVRDFFINGKLLQEINHTLLALIPKVTTPSCINDYCPISCCNALYKCISKIITNRLKDDLDDVVSNNQSAFVPGRCISDNILITQEIMHNYHLNRGPPRCAFKVDIQKAYDTVN